MLMLASTGEEIQMLTDCSGSNSTFCKDFLGPVVSLS